MGIILIFFLFTLPRSNTGFSSLLKEDVLTFGNIYIKGKTILSQKEIEKLLPKPGTPFRQNILEENIKKILKFYADRGFPFATISPLEFQLDSTSLSFELHIDPGNIYRIRNIIFKGNSTTSDEFLLRQFTLGNGFIFNEIKLQESIEELEKLNYIYVDSFHLIKGNDEGWVSILIFINEGNMGGIIGAISYSENGGWSGKFQAIGKNLFGGGRTIELKWQKEGNTYQEEIFQYKEPYIFSLPFSLTFDIQHSYIENISNKTSISTGVIYSFRDFLISFAPGVENYAKSGKGGISYPFIETSFFYEANPFRLFYRNKWKRGKGWILEISSMASLYYLNIYSEYFISSSNGDELLFYKPIRGYPGVIASKGLKFGIELLGKFDQLIIYPLLETSWIEDFWQYSYGIGIKVNKVSMEYAIPFDESPINGRVYITFHGGS